VRTKGRKGWIVLTLGVALAVAGCSSEGNGRDEAEGTSIVTNAAGDKTLLSGKQEWPKEFPAEIPRPDGMQVTASSYVETSGHITVAVETEQPFEEVIQIYRDYVKQAGYEQQQEMKEEGYYTYYGAKGAETFAFTIQLDLESGQKVTGVLIYANKT